MLGNPSCLRALWEKELGGCACASKAIRQKLVDGLRRSPALPAGHVVHDAASRHVRLLQPEQGPNGAPAQRFSVYGTDTGRICVAALNSRTSTVCQSIAKVM